MKKIRCQFCETFSCEYGYPGLNGRKNFFIRKGSSIVGTSFRGKTYLMMRKLTDTGYTDTSKAGSFRKIETLSTRSPEQSIDDFITEEEFRKVNEYQAGIVVC